MVKFAFKLVASTAKKYFVYIPNMRSYKYTIIPFLILILAIIMTGAVCSAQHNRENSIATRATDTIPKIVMAYVRSEGRIEEIPDPSLMTHICYAFAGITDDFKNIEIENPERFQEIVNLKNENPDLKILICIGGTKFKGFSEMAASKKNRKAFAKNVNNFLKKYNLDGVNLDWEFPGTENGGHSARPDDEKNYGEVVKELRKQLGKDKSISFYSNWGASYINFDVMLPWVDFVMASGYNLESIPLHQSNLYPSEKCGKWSVSKTVETHIKKGMPREKIVLGIPFYARWDSPTKGRQEMGQYGYKTLRRQYHLREVWDSVAQAPYFADEHGNLKASGDNPRSVKLKAEFIKDNGLRGAAYWHYTSEDSTHAMAKTLRDELMK